MKVGWLTDRSEYTGGAELTQAEFRAAAPVEVIDCPPGGVVPDLDRYVIHNCVTYSPDDFAVAQPAFRYHHDMRPVEVEATDIYCSPLSGDGIQIPPAIDLKAFRPSRQTRRNAKRSGAVAVGTYMNPGKGGMLLAEWAEEHGPLDIAGFGPYMPSETPQIRHLGAVDRADLPTLLWQYETFVHLPFAVEPFGRGVAEAWAAGCDLVVNNLVGARYWIEEKPEALDTAAEDFWELVTA